MTAILYNVIFTGIQFRDFSEMKISTGFDFAITTVKKKYQDVEITRFIIAVNGNHNFHIFLMRQHAHSDLALMLTVSRDSVAQRQSIVLGIEWSRVRNSLRQGN